MSKGINKGVSFELNLKINNLLNKLMWEQKITPLERQDIYECFLGFAKYYAKKKNLVYTNKKRPKKKQKKFYKLKNDKVKN